jgi:hypothetical protein
VTQRGSHSDEWVVGGMNIPAVIQNDRLDITDEKDLLTELDGVNNEESA